MYFIEYIHVTNYIYILGISTIWSNLYIWLIKGYIYNRYNIYCYYMKSSLPNRVKRHSKIWFSNVNPKFVDCVLAKKTLHICIYTNIFTYLWRALLQNTISEIGINIWNPFLLEWRLTRFGKEFFIYTAYFI